MKEMNMDTLENAVMKQLVCTRCEKFIRTTIRCCKGGHNLCTPCFQLVARCPQCKSSRSPGENFAMGQLRSKLKFSCKNKPSGCSFVGSIDFQTIHEDYCDYTSRICSFKHCFWVGTMKHFEKHCNVCHPSCTFRESCTGEIVNPLKLNIQNVIFRHGTAFMFRWSEHRTGVTCVEVNHIGEPSLQKKYIFELGLQDGEAGLKSICFSPMDELTNSSVPRSFEMPVTSLRELLHAGSLTYNLEITEFATISEEEEETLEDEAFMVLGCNYCDNFMKGPIYKCTSGHDLCDSCHALSRRCPVCGVSQLPTRNLSLEHISTLLIRPCRHAGDGCMYQGFNREMEGHAKECLFSHRACPMRQHLECSWQGNTMETTRHCLENHEEELSLQSNFVYDLRFQDETTGKSGSNVCFVHGRLFRFSYQFNEVTGVFRTGCYYFGDPLEKPCFYHKVLFLDVSGRPAAPRLKSLCYHIVDDSELFVKSFYTEVCQPRWTKPSTENMSFKFAVDIERK